MIYAGMDAGSRSVKVVAYDSQAKAVVGSGVTDQGIAQATLAESLLAEVLDKCEVRREDIRRIIATGYGRDAIEFADETVTEITCHACGVQHVVPGTRTVIDIGGQDSKLIRMDADGSVRDFVMNDRCAAGTGRFLEVVADRLETDLDSLGAMSARADAPAAISSMCVVFAETEIIGLLANGESPENIVAGVQHAIAARTATMGGRTVSEPIIFTGGVALVSGMRAVLAEVLGKEVSICPDPQLTGALGAALLAERRDVDR